MAMAIGPFPTLRPEHPALKSVIVLQGLPFRAIFRSFCFCRVFTDLDKAPKLSSNPTRIGKTPEPIKGEGKWAEA